MMVTSRFSLMLFLFPAIINPSRACLRRSAAFNDLYKSLLDSILEAPLELLGLRIAGKSRGKPRDSRSLG